MTTASENGTTLLATYAYDAMSRRTNLALPHSTNVSYSYSDAGDLLTLNHDITAGGVPHFTLQYTAAHQLSSEASSQSAYVWQPTSAATDSYTPANKLNQYPSWTPQGSATQSFAYDLNGNMTTGTIAGVQWSFAYDPENRLMTASKTTGGTVSAAYAYDPLGRRTHKSGTGVSETYFLDDGDDEIAEFNGAGTLNWRYIPGPAINEPIGSVSGNTGARRFYQTDHHGSLISVVNNAGAQIEGPYIYDSYGNCFSGIQTCAVAGGTPYKFTGMRLDNETGLYYDRARYYSSIVGRYMQVDPVGYVNQMNLYAYGRNDPENNVDPLGRYTCSGDSCDDFDAGVVRVAEARNGLAKASPQYDRLSRILKMYGKKNDSSRIQVITKSNEGAGETTNMGNYIEIVLDLTSIRHSEPTYTRNGIDTGDAMAGLIANEGSKASDIQDKAIPDDNTRKSFSQFEQRGADAESIVYQGLGVKGDTWDPSWSSDSAERNRQDAVNQEAKDATNFDCTHNDNACLDDMGSKKQ